MKYSEAYELVKAGKHVKRLAWDHPDSINMRLFLLPEAPMVWLTQKSNTVAGGINCGAYGLTIDDLQCNDWVEISNSWLDLHEPKQEALTDLIETVVLEGAQVM